MRLVSWVNTSQCFPCRQTHFWCRVLGTRDGAFPIPSRIVGSTELVLVATDHDHDHRTFNCPPSFASGPLATQLDALEDFWEAEARRIGEPEARGWDAWEREGGRQSLPPGPAPISPPREPSRMDVGAAHDPYARWAADEARADAESSMPKRGDDAGEDPYATILFSDLRPLLVHLATPRAKRALRFAWLEFLGLHVPGFAASLSENSPSAGRDDVWSHTHLARTPFLRRLFPSQRRGTEKEWDAYAGTIIAREKTYGSPFGCVKEWGMGVFTPLEGWSGGKGRMWEDVDVEGVDKGVVRLVYTSSLLRTVLILLVRRVFEQLRRKVVVPGEDEDDEWDVMALAFETTTNLKRFVIGLLCVHTFTSAYHFPARASSRECSCLPHAILFPSGALMHAFSRYGAR